MVGERSCQITLDFKIEAFKWLGNDKGERNGGDGILCICAWLRLPCATSKAKEDVRQNKLQRRLHTSTANEVLTLNTIIKG